MTFPGVEGIVGPGWLSTIGFQVRQSRVSPYGGKASITVLDAMGSHAPAWGVTAEAVTVEQEMAQVPHAIEQENFELDFDQATTTTADFGSAEDYTGLGGSVADSTFPTTLPYQFEE